MKTLINEECWNKQYNFNSLLNHVNLHIDEKQKLTKEYVLYIVSEATELLENINWKMHRANNDKTIILSNVSEEIIDLFKFVIGLCNIWGISNENLFEEFLRKTNVVGQRYKQEVLNSLNESDSIAVFDLDGVLAVYPEYFISYVNNIEQTKFTDINEVKNVLGVVKYENIKHNYRESGLKRFAPIVNGAYEVINKLISEFKFKIVILSSRPYSKYNRIYADTIEWLKSNNLFDKISLIDFDEDKQRKLVEKIPNIKFAVEDNLTIANAIAKLGCFVYLLNNKYNSYGEVNKNVVRIDSLKDLLVHWKQYNEKN